ESNEVFGFVLTRQLALLKEPFGKSPCQVDGLGNQKRLVRVVLPPNEERLAPDQFGDEQPTLPSAKNPKRVPGGVEVDQAARIDNLPAHVSLLDHFPSERRENCDSA